MDVKLYRNRSVHDVEANRPADRRSVV